MTLRFKPAELQYFNWMFQVAPCFGINSSKINIITDPSQFYNVLCERFKNAKRRISIASLYFGTGELERKLLEITIQNVKRQNDISLKMLLDYQRGTRGEHNSRTLYQQLVSDASERCKLALYQTPRLQSSWCKVLPSRYNEIIGLQHMKLYIADDYVVLSGANCSNDYFQQRQDRYIEIEDAELANFYCELIDEVSEVSKQEEESSNKINSVDFTQNIVTFIEKWKERQSIKLLKLNDSKEMDTWVFPLIQMGEFNIHQDELTTSGILASGPKGSFFRLATGYFNLTKNYENVLLQKCEANISLLMAHPNANGFLGAAGPAGGIPHAYSLIAKRFWQKVVDSNQMNRVQMLEYERPGWTFHAKGLWYYPPGSGLPSATLVGSANLGERSVRRDLEAQAAIFTVSPELRERLHDECSKLHMYSSECGQDLQERKTPLWVKATVGLFKTYF